LGFAAPEQRKEYALDHIHVVKGNAEAKFSLLPEIKIIYNHGLKASELKKSIDLIDENKEIIIERWNEFFNNK